LENAVTQQNLWGSSIIAATTNTSFSGGESYLSYKNLIQNNYDTGREANGGLITSPDIIVPKNQQLNLDFRSNLDVEADPNYDLTSVKITVDGKDIVLDKNSIGLGQNNPSLGLISRSGIIRITFSFDTVDSLYNSTSGWEVRDLKITLAQDAITNSSDMSSNSSSNNSSLYSSSWSPAISSSSSFYSSKSSSSYSSANSFKSNFSSQNSTASSVISLPSSQNSSFTFSFGGSQPSISSPANSDPSGN
jgi:hypothetical protein